MTLRSQGRAGFMGGPAAWVGAYQHVHDQAALQASKGHGGEDEGAAWQVLIGLCEPLD
jgi:hypothetical protein